MNANTNPATIDAQPVTLGKITMEAIILQRWRDLAKVANGIIPTNIPMQPMQYDADDLASDIRALARVLMPLIEDYGAYAKHTLYAECDDAIGAISDALSELEGGIVKAGAAFAE